MRGGKRLIDRFCQDKRIGIPSAPDAYGRQPGNQVQRTRERGKRFVVGNGKA